MCALSVFMCIHVRVCLLYCTICLTDGGSRTWGNGGEAAARGNVRDAHQTLRVRRCRGFFATSSNSRADALNASPPAAGPGPGADGTPGTAGRTGVDCGTGTSSAQSCGVEAGGKGGGKLFRLVLEKPLRASMQEIEEASVSAPAASVGPALTTTTTTAWSTTPAGDLNVRALAPNAFPIETHTMEMLERCTESKTRCSTERNRQAQAPRPPVSLVAQVAPCSRSTHAFIPKCSSSDSAQTSPGSGGSASGCSTCASDSRSGRATSSSCAPNEKSRRDRCSCAKGKKSRPPSSRKMPEICRGGTSGAKGDLVGLPSAPCPPMLGSEADADYHEDHRSNGIPRFCKCWIFCMKQG